MIGSIRTPGLLMRTLWMAFCYGCLSPNYEITGQVEMLQTDRYGDLTAAEEPQDPVLSTKGDTFSLRLTSVFVKQVKELPPGAAFLVYAEVYDIQPDDRQRLVKVLFKENNQSAGYLINQRDRLLFGPILHNGHPIRIRLFVVELDKEENAIAGEMIKQAVRVASSFVPLAAPFEGTVTSIGDLFLTLNQDGRELAYDFTLFPTTHSHGPFLRTGHIVLIKTENRVRAAAPTGEPAQDIRNEYGHRIVTTPEDYASTFSYGEGDELHPNVLQASRDGAYGSPRHGRPTLATVGCL